MKQEKQLRTVMANKSVIIKIKRQNTPDFQVVLGRVRTRLPSGDERDLLR